MMPSIQRHQPSRNPSDCAYSQQKKLFARLARSSGGGGGRDEIYAELRTKNEKDVQDRQKESDEWANKVLPQLHELMDRAREQFAGGDHSACLATVEETLKALDVASQRRGMSCLNVDEQVSSARDELDGLRHQATLAEGTKSLQAALEQVRERMRPVSTQVGLAQKGHKTLATALETQGDAAQALQTCLDEMQGSINRHRAATVAGQKARNLEQERMISGNAWLNAEFEATMQGALERTQLKTGVGSSASLALAKLRAPVPPTPDAAAIATFVLGLAMQWARDLPAEGVESWRAMQPEGLLHALMAQPELTACPRLKAALEALPPDAASPERKTLVKLLETVLAAVHSGLEGAAERPHASTVALVQQRLQGSHDHVAKRAQAFLNTARLSTVSEEGF